MFIATTVVMTMMLECVAMVGGQFVLKLVAVTLQLQS